MIWKQLSFKEAKRLGIKKWQMHVDAGGHSNLTYKDEELRCLLGSCGFCERWKMNCEKCEFGKVGGYCHCRGSLFNKWVLQPTKENAEKITAILIEIDNNKKHNVYMII